MINQLLLYQQLSIYITDRTREIKAWKGVGKIPKPLTRWEQRKFIRSTFPDESDKFVLEQKALAELEAKAIVNGRHRRHLEERTVAFVFDMFLSEVFRQIKTEQTNVNLINICII